MKNTNIAKKLPCKVETIKKVAQDIAVVTLKLPASEKFDYSPGQYIDILLKDGKRRSYSMANSPNEKNIIELHIKHTPGGAFTDAIFSDGSTSINHVKEKDILRLEGPLGTFFLREKNENIIFLASGTGIAPIKAIFEKIIKSKLNKKILLYWGVRKPNDLYIHDLINSWLTKLTNFSYIPVVSEAEKKDKWNGRTGFVHEAVIQDFPDLKNYNIYACGAPIMINSALKDFVNLCKLPKENFYSDAFTSAADK
jgi:CDP-4-dehydro-6-deoxyglucose reductase